MIIEKNTCIQKNNHADMHIEAISIAFKATNVFLVKNLTCIIKAGTVLSIMGASGSGKSTLLSVITGTYDRFAFTCSGSIICGGACLEDLVPEKRRIGLLDQDYLLFPHMTVAENLLFAVREKLDKRQRNDAVKNALTDAKLEYSFALRYPHTLSGGQQARVALMRTFLSNPQLILLDEPFSGLDSIVRGQIREFVFKEIKQRKIPAILVTHDKEDVANASSIIML